MRKRKPNMTRSELKIARHSQLTLTKAIRQAVPSSTLRKPKAANQTTKATASGRIIANLAMSATKATSTLKKSGKRLSDERVRLRGRPSR